LAPAWPVTSWYVASQRLYELTTYDAHDDDHDHRHPNHDGDAATSDDPLQGKETHGSSILARAWPVTTWYVASQRLYELTMIMMI
jgi:hypothetical protein